MLTEPEPLLPNETGRLSQQVPDQEQSRHQESWQRITQQPDADVRQQFEDLTQNRLLQAPPARATNAGAFSDDGQLLCDLACTPFKKNFKKLRRYSGADGGCRSLWEPAR